MMKAWILPILAILLIGQVSAALVTKGSSLDASLLYYEPVPAQPGDLLDVRILVTNNGGSTSKGGTIRFLNSYPFTVENSDEKTQEFPPVPGQESFLVRTRVRVDKAAEEGTNILTAVIQETGQAQIEKRFEIDIQGRAGALTITEARTVPEMISPGSTGQLLIEVRNIGDTRLRNVNVDLNLSTLDIAPAGGSTSQTIDSLEGGNSHLFAFGLTAFPEAETNAYKLPVTITYDDEQGNNVTQEKTIGILVSAKPELLVYFDQVNVMEDTNEGNVIIRFVNKGLSEIKLLEAEVIENDHVEVLSESPLSYVGNIDEDDYETADMRLKVSGETDVPITIRYRDALNQHYEEQLNLRLSPKKSQGGSGTTIFVVILLLIVAVLGFFWWRKRKKRDKR